MSILGALTVLDWIALAVFLLLWAAYEPMLKAVGRAGGLINTDMQVVRIAWMRNMALRDVKLMDGQLLGQVLNSNSFFASSNLLLIAAAAGALFGGSGSFETAASVIKTSSRSLFELQVGLVIVTLARGFLAFIWSIRQLNYCLAAIGAAPDPKGGADHQGYAAAVARLLNPALSSFNAGVRGYYFAMAAAAWLFGAVPFFLATVGAVSLLFYRQRMSPTSAAVQDLRRFLEASD